jgi:hypothetical protein
MPNKAPVPDDEGPGYNGGRIGHAEPTPEETEAIPEGGLVLENP